MEVSILINLRQIKYRNVDYIFNYLLVQYRNESVNYSIALGEIILKNQHPKLFLCSKKLRRKLKDTKIYLSLVNILNLYASKINENIR